jgi:hypothetical protein
MYAKQKAKEWNTEALCRFETGDVNETVRTERGYDCVIFGSAGDVLGNPRETLEKLRDTIKDGGFIIMDATYLSNGGNTLKWAYEYLRRDDWLRLFEENGLKLTEELADEEEYDFAHEIKVISERANELIKKYPEKRKMFEGYVQSQQNEVADLENSLTGGTWILRRVDVGVNVYRPADAVPSNLRAEHKHF